MEIRSANKLKRQLLTISSFNSFGSFGWSTIWNQKTPNGKDSLRFFLEEEGEEEGIRESAVFVLLPFCFLTQPPLRRKCKETGI